MPDERPIALVTGADGFIGSHLVSRLLHSGWTVAAVVRNLQLRRLKEHEHLLICQGDLQEKIPFTGKPDVVFSLAATADPVKALRFPKEAYANDTRIMVETLEYAKNVEAKVIHLSTNEVNQFSPEGPYAGGKACQEIVCESYSDLPAYVVVTQSIFGERQQPEKFIPTAIRNLLSGLPVPVQHSFEGYPSSRPFLYVGVLVDGLINLANWLPTQDASQKDAPRARRYYGAGSEVSVPLTHLVTAVATILGRDPVMELIPSGMRPGHGVRVQSLKWDIPGDVTRVGMSEPHLVKVVNWYQDHPEWLDV